MEKEKWKVRKSQNGLYDVILEGTKEKSIALCSIASWESKAEAEQAKELLKNISTKEENIFVNPSKNGYVDIEIIAYNHLMARTTSQIPELQADKVVEYILNQS